MHRLSPIHLILLTPAQALATLMLFGPALYVLWLSFNVSNFGMDLQFAGFQNYVTVLTDPYFWTASLNTLIIVNVVVYVELLLAFGIAMIVASMKTGRMVLFAIVMVPYAISEVVGILSWRFLADPNVGIITKVFAELGLGRLNWMTDPTSALGLISTISIWQHLPFSFVLLYAAIISVPQDLHEAGRVDGANKWQHTWYITLPIILPAALLAIVFRYVFAFRMFAEVWLVTKGGPIRLTEVLGTYLYRTGFSYGDFGAAAATGWLMVLGSLLLASFYLRAMYRKSFQNG